MKLVSLINIGISDEMTIHLLGLHACKLEILSATDIISIQLYPIGLALEVLGINLSLFILTSELSITKPDKIKEILKKL